MSKKKTITYDISDAVGGEGALLEFPGDLPGLLHEVNGQSEIKNSEKNDGLNEDAASNGVTTDELIDKPVEKDSSPSKAAKKNKTASSKTKDTSVKPAPQASDAPFKEIPSDDDMWSRFTAMCIEDSTVQKKMGRGNLGTTSTVRVEKDLLEALRLCPVNGHSITTMVNSMIRVFFMFYRDKFKEYQVRTSNPLLD